MQKMIVLDVEDIVTRPCGNNWSICDGDIKIALTPEALSEIYGDIFLLHKTDEDFGGGLDKLKRLLDKVMF